ncbi:MAG: response regulator [Candidatus Poribacteria bacterium]|nr:response regulator [Candidatus Poribacteria bacterium]
MARILVIDDDDQVRGMLRQMLERAGYEVIEAPDGEEGMRLYREAPSDLVIMDLIMPEKEGIESIAVLRRDFPDVKIIAISGDGHIGPDDYLHVAEMLGARRTFAKPLDWKAVLQSVREIIDHAAELPSN